MTPLFSNSGCYLVVFQRVQHIKAILQLNSPDTNKAEKTKPKNDPKEPQNELKFFISTVNCSISNYQVLLEKIECFFVQIFWVGPLLSWEIRFFSEESEILGHFKQTSNDDLMLFAVSVQLLPWSLNPLIRNQFPRNQSTTWSKWSQTSTWMTSLQHFQSSKTDLSTTNCASSLMELPKVLFCLEVLICSLSSSLVRGAHFEGNTEVCLILEKIKRKPKVFINYQILNMTHRIQKNKMAQSSLSEDITCFLAQVTSPRQPTTSPNEKQERMSFYGFLANKQKGTLFAVIGDDIQPK